MDSTPISALPTFQKTAELPIRDVPKETVSHVMDPQSVAPHTYIPPVQEYIPYQPTSNTNKIGKFVQDFKVPILIAILFYLFSNAQVKGMLESMFPFMVEQTNIGLAAKSVAFAVLFYISTQLMESM